MCAGTQFELVVPPLVGPHPTVLDGGHFSLHAEVMGGQQTEDMQEGDVCHAPATLSHCTTASNFDPGPNPNISPNPSPNQWAFEGFDGVLILNGTGANDVITSLAQECRQVGLVVRVVCNTLQLTGQDPNSECGPRGLCYLSHVDEMHRQGVDIFQARYPMDPAHDWFDAGVHSVCACCNQIVCADTCQRLYGYVGMSTTGWTKTVQLHQMALRMRNDPIDPLQSEVLSPRPINFLRQTLARHFYYHNGGQANGPRDGRLHLVLVNTSIETYETAAQRSADTIVC